MRHPQRVALSRSSHPRPQLGPGLCKGAGGRPGAGWGPGWGQRLRTAGAPLRSRSALRHLRGTARASEGPLGPQRCGHPRGELGGGGGRRRRRRRRLGGRACAVRASPARLGGLAAPQEKGVVPRGACAVRAYRPGNEHARGGRGSAPRRRWGAGAVFK